MATTLDTLTDEVLMYLNGYGLVQPRAAWLTDPVDASTTELKVTSTDDFSRGLAEIGTEMVYVQKVDPATLTLTLAPDGRGFYGTTATSHASGARIVSAPTWPRVQVQRAINDTIAGAWPDVFGVASATFTFTPAVTTYSIPSDAERVLAVSYDTLGPSKSWQRLSRYHFDSAANEGEYPTGNSLTLFDAIPPGRTVQVVYTKRPSTLESAASAFTDSGLAESARLAVVYGACAQLISYMDSAQLPIHAAEADEYDSDRKTGIASRVAAQLYARHVEEVGRERRRLHAAHKPTITYTKGR